LQYVNIADFFSRIFLTKRLFQRFGGAQMTSADRSREN
jgi:hypothetical protein